MSPNYETPPSVTKQANSNVRMFRNPTDHPDVSHRSRHDILPTRKRSNTKSLPFPNQHILHDYHVPKVINNKLRKRGLWNRTKGYRMLHL